MKKGIEDVHSQVELMLTRALGEMGKKIHSGRSRNDQALLLDLKLFARAEIEETVTKVCDLFNVLIAQSNRYKNVLMPGYTHLQIAMPSSFGLCGLPLTLKVLPMTCNFCSRPTKLPTATRWDRLPDNGSSFPLNRQMTTDLLGFETMNYNVVYAQMGRGKMERVVTTALASVAATLSKLAFDACMFSSQNFGFIKLPDAFTTGSSIMPHKKNPDVFELTRAKCNKIQAIPQQITMIREQPAIRLFPRLANYQGVFRSYF